MTAVVSQTLLFKLTRNRKLPTITGDVIAVRVDFGVGTRHGASNQARLQCVVGLFLEFAAARAHHSLLALHILRRRQQREQYRGNTLIFATRGLFLWFDGMDRPNIFCVQVPLLPIYDG